MVKEMVKSNTQAVILICFPLVKVVLLLGERSEPHTGVFNRDFA